MVDQTETAAHLPRLHVDTDAIIIRMAALAEVQLCAHCAAPVVDAMVDIASLLAEVIRLHTALIEVRRESANRLAAIRAALGAASDGENDPLAYLRDELAESTDVPSRVRGGGWCA